MFKNLLIFLVLIINGIVCKKQMPSVDSSAHKEVNLKITTDNAKITNKQMKPDIHDLEPNNYDKKKANRDRTKDMKVLEPSADLLEKTIEINKNDSLDSNQTKHEIEPNVENLENLINIITRNGTAIENTNMQNNQMYGEKFHDLIIGFHGSVLNQSNLNDSKPADLDDYARWIELEKNLSKLSRFKKLHEEITNFESVNLNRERYDVSEEDERIVVEAKRKDHKLSKKLELTIQQIEHSERKKKRSDL